MSFGKFFGIPIRFISQSTVRQKIPSLGTFNKKEIITDDKIKLSVESNPQRLVEYVCGTNLLNEGGEDIKVKPDSEYPEWLWSIRSPPPLEELDQNSKTYWNRIIKKRMAEEKFIRGLKRNSKVHK